MTNMTIKGLVTVAAAAMAISSVGCANDEAAPEFKDGSGQAAPEQAADAYPTTPWGFEIGSTLPNMSFVGYANFTDPNLEGLQLVQLAEFYNPTGDGVFPAGSPYGEGNPKPKAINMLISSMWCGPCRHEAENVLPVEYAKYKPLGGEFMAVLIDGPQGGVPATIGNLTSWADQYKTNYTMVMDPSSKVMQWYEPAFPGNLIIRTSDMTVIEVVAGVPQPAFWDKFEKVLDGTYEG